MMKTKIKINFKWNSKTYNDFIKYLESIGDSKTKEFNERIMHTKYEILGIKVPILRTIAKDISKTDFKEFFKYIKNEYYEVVLIEGILLSYIKDNNEFLEYFHKFIYKIDDWSICDTCINSYKFMKDNDFSDIAYSLILDSHEYIERVGYVILLNYYIDEEHIDTILSLCTKESDYYYVNMAISWLLCECFIKSRTKTLNLIKSKNLSHFVQNKTISKIRESYKVSKEDKELVKELKY